MSDEFDFDDEGVEPAEQRRPYTRHVRETSVEAYQYLVESGNLAKQHAEAYDILYRFGPMTTNELYQHTRSYEHSIDFRHNQNARMSELHRQGLIQKIGTRPCKITGRRVLLWDVTSRVVPLPIRPKEFLKAEEWTKLLLTEILIALETENLPPVITRDVLLEAMLRLERRSKS
jgi:hypothetical protein